MNEHDVWKYCVEYFENNGGKIHAACPPGGSSIYPRCMLYNSITRKRDEPDLLATIGNDLYIIEAKQSLEQSFKQGLKASSNESDYDKLVRIAKDYNAGFYDKQLKENYLINVHNYSMHIAITYHSQSTVISGPTLGLDHFIVSNTGSVLLVSH